MRHSISRVRIILCGTIASLATLAVAADPAGPRSEADILNKVKLPDGYEATVFAKPPELGYPTSVSAAADGTIFVAVDENGSLDRKEKRGRVVRMRDTNGDGKADEFKTFAEMDSPRGVIWDGAKGAGPGTLYVMHPPNLTAYTDVDGDGKADKQEEIITGLGFDLNFRGADHTTNGCRLGIDGWIYIAVGDYGYVEAKGKDGTTIKNRGGGIVRVRPDGTGLEIVSRGQRNIYDVAVSPTLDLFTRDNTNDGGGWDVRLSHVPAGAHMGYPTLFKNFPEDMLQPLFDYGGGSPCGSLWVDEPGLQNGLYTVEWGKNAIMYHPLTANGATWKPEQKEWLKLVRPTDMDVDASGKIYVTSWEGATFNYNGPNAGYVLRVAKKDAPAAQPLDVSKLNDAQLLQVVASPSAVARQTAQREILRRGAKPGVAEGLQKIATSPGELNGRIAALETLKQLRGAAALPVLAQLANDPALREFALNAEGDDVRLAKNVPAQAFTAALNDPSPRVRIKAITGLRRLGKSDAAQSILPLVADADPVVAHLATRALRELNASQVCLGALDSSDPKVQPGALRALYGIYEPAVVEGLIARLPGAKGELRKGILNALCRLDNQDEVYTDPKVWWGTRPDTTGPVYKPVKWSESEKIETVLKKVLDSAKDDEARWLVQNMYRTKISFPGLVELMLAKAGSDTAAKLTAIEGLFGSDNSLPPEAADALLQAAQNEKETPDLRAKALRLLQRGADNGNVFPRAFTAFAPLAGHDLPNPALTAAFEDFTRDAKNTKWIGEYSKAVAGKDAGRRNLALTVLVNLATSNLVKGKDKDAAVAAVDKAWSNPESSAALLGVIARTHAKAYADQVRGKLNDPNNAVAEAALFAFQKLGLNQTTTAAAQPIGGMKYEAVASAVAKGGDAAQGKDIFLRAGCIACHTTSADEPPKGPILSAVAKIYDRAALTESILKPSAKIAQGFESQWFKTKKGEQVEGFVTREGGDSVDVRNIIGQTVALEKGDVVERGKRETSIMPEGLMNGFTTAEFANLLAFLESLKK